MPTHDSTTSVVESCYFVIRVHLFPFAVPDKIFGLTLILDFIDRGTRCAFAYSATGRTQARGHPEHRS